MLLFNTFGEYSYFTACLFLNILADSKMVGNVLFLFYFKYLYLIDCLFLTDVRSGCTLCETNNHKSDFLVSKMLSKSLYVLYASKAVSNLVFYAQSTITVILGQASKANRYSMY